MDQISAGHEAAEALRRGDYEQAAREIAEPWHRVRSALAGGEEPACPGAPPGRQRLVELPGAFPGRAPRRRRPDRPRLRAARQAHGRPGGSGDHARPERDPAVGAGRAWDQVNQERRAQGQPDSNGSARRPGGAAAARVSKAQGQRGQQGQGQQGQQGQSNQPQNGQGIGTAPSHGRPARRAAGRRAGAAPGHPGQAGRGRAEARPAARPQPRRRRQARRQAAGRGRADSASAAGSPGQVTSAAPPEINFVPSGRRDIVREYFRGPGEARNHE